MKIACIEEGVIRQYENRLFGIYLVAKHVEHPHSSNTINHVPFRNCNLSVPGNDVVDERTVVDDGNIVVSSATLRKSMPAIQISVHNSFTGYSSQLYIFRVVVLPFKSHWAFFAVHMHAVYTIDSPAEARVFILQNNLSQLLQFWLAVEKHWSKPTENSD